MALSTQSALPSLPWAESAPRWKYDVFLSFRGEDTRRGFISHLYHELQYWQTIKTFKDDRELEIGASISPEILTAIEESRLAIVVLSPNYASSTWCLDELAKILESMETRDNTILPVFFNVDPSDVRKQRKSVAEVFAKHEEKFSDDIEKVKRWRAALRKVANLSGWDSKNFQCERELIKVIVKCVWTKVRPTITLSDSTDKLVGIDAGLMELGLLLAPEANDVRFIGIWGMGGIGKTTLSKLVFERISHHFEVSKFLINVREVSSKYGTVVDLQRQLLSPILKENIGQVWDEQEGVNLISKCLLNKKVLLIIDDVDHYDQVEKLGGNKSWFGEGSRIIVTTRDERLLIEHDIGMSFKILRLNDNKSLELFSQNAFKKHLPEEGFFKLSKCFVDYAKGLPLALKILGRSLYKRDQQAWNSALDKLKKIPHPTIFEKLRLSYDALGDDMQKNIFLDVAFFYKGMEKGRIIEMLESCGICGRIGIDVLIEKSLLTIERCNNVIGMHDLIQDMAWELVGRESREEPGLRSRLCHRDDIFHVFMRNTGTEAIRGIRLCLPSLEEADSNWNCEGFSKMRKLMFLEFDNLKISSGPKFLPNSLRILKWNWYPSKYLAASFRPNLLVNLEMQRSQLVRLWDGKQDLPNLKYMNLGDSKNLKKSPDFTGIPNLVDLDLGNCTGLVEIHPSIAVNKKLKRLMLSKCKCIKNFPSKIEMDSLEILNLDWCSKVKIPEFGEGMKNLVLLQLHGTASEKIPSSIEHLVGLSFLGLSDCKSLESFPRNIIFKLKSLTEVNIDGCSKLKKLLETKTELGGSSSMMRKLFGRRKSSLEPLLPSVVRTLPCLEWLQVSDCHLCQGAIPDDIGYCLPSLQRLELCGNNFVTLPASIKCLSKLRLIELSGCERLQQLPDLPLNTELDVQADHCASLKMLLSEPISQQSRSFTNLETFRLDTLNCFGLVDDEGWNNGIFSMLRRLATQAISPEFKRFEIISPGSKISEWFNIQSERDSLTVELPKDLEWMGIVFCLVLAADHLKNPDPVVLCRLSEAIDDARIARYPSRIAGAHHLSLRIPDHMMGDHLWVFYMPRAKIQYTTSLLFETTVTTSSNSVKKRCGARLVYEQDLKQLLSERNINVLKRSRDEHCDDEGPSGSKMIKSLFKRLKG